MKYPTRIYYTEADKALMWDRWQKGESLNSIARHFGRSHSSIQGVLARTGVFWQGLAASARHRDSDHDQRQPLRMAIDELCSVLSRALGPRRVYVGITYIRRLRRA